MPDSQTPIQVEDVSIHLNLLFFPANLRRDKRPVEQRIEKRIRDAVERSKKLWDDWNN
jgi:hypothetical protein